MRWAALYRRPPILCGVSASQIRADHAWNIEVAQSKSEQAGAPEKLLKTMVGAIAIKERIDGEVFHPDGAVAICGFEPLECVFFAVQRCVDLSQPVRRNVTLPRDCFQFERDAECFTLPPRRGQGNPDLRRVKWATP